MASRSWLDALQAASLEPEKPRPEEAMPLWLTSKKSPRSKKAITLSPSGLSASMPYLCHRREWTG